MKSLQENLYRRQLLEHHRHPRNFGELPDATHWADAANPMCGDRIHISVRLVDGRIAEIAFSGEGCAIFRASASMMTEGVKNRTPTAVRAIAADLDAWLKGAAEPEGSEGSEGSEELWQELAALGGVRGFPMRISCAMLPWQALNSALKES